MHINEQINAFIDDLLNGRPLPPENIILQTVEEYDKQLQTNCDTAAYLLMINVSTFCAFYPRLENKLLCIALEPLLWLGLEQEKQIRAWLTSFLDDDTTCQQLTKPGLSWIQSLCTGKQDLTNCVLAELKIITCIRNLLLDANYDLYTNTLQVKESVSLEGVYRSFTQLSELMEFLQTQFYAQLKQYPQIDTEPEDIEYLITRELFDKRHLQKIGGLE